MEVSIYNYRDYKRYFVDLIAGSKDGPRGKRRALAESIGCQVSHVTNVLSGDAQFSQEQAEAAARFFGQNPRETEFLLIMVQFNRAGTASLSQFYKKLLDEKQEKHTTLKKLLNMPDELKSENEALYYSSWHFGAVHVLLSIPEYQTREAVSTKLNLPLEKIDEILNFLTESRLAEKIGQRYILNRSTIHLDNSSPLITKHHTNWRLRTIIGLDKRDNSHFHYSSAVTLSHNDYAKVREILTKALTASLKVITSSPEEEIAVLCMDYFKL